MATLWTREQVAAKILAGDHLVVYHDSLLRIPSKWLEKHPGGALSILHFVGRDASDEIDSYHPDQVLELIQRYKIGSVSAPWAPLVPPVASGWVRTDSNSWFNEASSLRKGQTEILLVSKQPNAPDAPTRAILEPPPSTLSLDDQLRHSQAYKELHRRVREAGLYDTRYIAAHGPDVIRYSILAGLSAYAYFNGWFLTSALFLGLFWQQLTFIAHDLGHVSVTHNWAIDRLLGIVIADWIGGLSIGWWVDNHNVHHLVTNHPTHDPDIGHLPFIAISPVFFNSLWSTYRKRILDFDRFSQFFVQLQHRLFYILLGLARFNLYANSYPFLIRKAFDTRRARGAYWAWALEVAGIVCFWCWYGRVVINCDTWKTSMAYFLISHIAASPVHVQIVLSHFSMSTEDLGPTESFPDRQLRTTTDVICPDWLGWIHGGLQLQVTHHLFPRLPRHNLKAASALAKEFAQEQGLVYAEFGWIEGNGDVLGVLRDVADQVKILGQVADAEVKQAIDRKMAQ
ncbi:Delta 8-sphingoloid desaturase protein [Mycena indigotica]|uniref:Delta 8-(E)-sphingolipid desaturase n=1 Tax=Mycena indigotica TaxID=2126181 RepID=A0A8H6SYZ4_9AGAR|nr:Delta 8-sphingoloid desaturase protein [Mycena indigotica]KAF7306867.1 Delta 8-sphingoloid desaturase protein [Mycena indigotica]